MLYQTQLAIAPFAASPSLTSSRGRKLCRPAIVSFPGRLGIPYAYPPQQATSACRSVLFLDNKQSWPPCLLHPHTVLTPSSTTAEPSLARSRSERGLSHNWTTLVPADALGQYPILFTLAPLKAVVSLSGPLRGQRKGSCPWPSLVPPVANSAFPKWRWYKSLRNGGLRLLQPRHGVLVAASPFESFVPFDNSVARPP